MDDNDGWEDFGVRIGPFGFGMEGPMRNFRYHRGEGGHRVQLKIHQHIWKEEIKVPLVKPGLFEIEWPRKIQGEKIPVE